MFSSNVTSATPSLAPLPSSLREVSRELFPSTCARRPARRSSLRVGNEPARRAQIEKVINDAAARVRHLSGVLGEWRLEEMSPAQTANLLGMLEQLQRRLRTSGELLQSWSDGFRAALGPEETQTLFWDLVDGAAGGAYAAAARAIPPRAILHAVV